MSRELATPEPARIKIGHKPIRVNAGPQKRGRKLSDCARYLIRQAVLDIQRCKRSGLPVSVREAAERFKVPKSTLHRYLRNSCALSQGPPKQEKHAISFLLQSDNAVQEPKPSLHSSTPDRNVREEDCVGCSRKVPKLQEQIGCLQTEVENLQEKLTNVMKQNM